MALAAVLLGAAPASAQRVLVAFAPVDFAQLSAQPELSVGLLGATQGAYSVRQTLLDLTQGSRISRSGYDPGSAPALRLEGRRIAGWLSALRRAHSAPAVIQPGLLAQNVPGGAGYAGIAGTTNVEAVVAADRSGRVTEVSLAGFQDVASRARIMLAHRRLVVANLADPADVDQLVRERRPDEALIVIRTPPRSRTAQLLPSGAAGLGERAPGLLRSRTTRRRGYVAGIDLLPTVLGHLGVPLPRDVHGRPITVDGPRDVAYVRRLDRRLRVVYPRRTPAMLWLVGTLALLGIAAAAVPRLRRPAARAAGLALLWVPALSLATAALAPSRLVEMLIVGPGAVVLGVLTDRLVPWPRAPAVPGVIGIVWYLVDLALGSPLIVRSLLGPNPRFGARFYGIGNELEAVLPVLALVALAALLDGRPRSRALALAFAGACLVLGLFVGAGRLGADVGGVITIGAAGAAATVCALPGGPTRRSVAIACAIPVLAVGALAVVDAVTGGDSHFSSTILHADNVHSLAEVARRRITLALHAAVRGLMPLATVLAIAGIVLAIRRRTAWFGHLSAPWVSALVGGVAAGVAGTLGNDSGPVLLVLATVVLLAATLYLRGQPTQENGPPRSIG